MLRSWTLPSAPSVLVTGASSGIGEATALRFAREGARLGLVARRKDRLDQLAERVRALGGVAVAVPADLGEESAARGAVRRIEAELGGLDVLVNNAGFGLYAPIESVSRGDLERLFAVNTFGALACMQEALPGMRRRRGGVIINISSVVGKRALPMTGAYGASKYALHALSDALRVELRGTGIQVTVLCPGYTTTEFSEHVVDYGAERGRPLGGAMSAEAVADVVFDCARRPRREVVLTGKGRLLVLLNRFFPGLTDRALARKVPVRLPPLDAEEPLS